MVKKRHIGLGLILLSLISPFEEMAISGILGISFGAVMLISGIILIVINGDD